VFLYDARIVEAKEKLKKRSIGFGNTPRMSVYE
jgi:hypothetical protein